MPSSKKTLSKKPLSKKSSIKKIPKIKLSNTLYNIPLLELKGVGPKVNEKLNKLGLNKLQDLLLFFPLRYQNRRFITPISQLIVDTEVLTRGVIESSFTQTMGGYRGRHKKLFMCELSDAQGAKLNLRFFHFSQRQLIRYQNGQELLCYGTIKYGRQGLEIIHPDVVFVEEGKADLNNKLEYHPIYHLSEGLSQQTIHHLVSQSLEFLAQEKIIEYLPDNILKQYKLPTYQASIAYLHRPSDELPFEQLQTKNNIYYRRLVLEELTAHQINVLDRQQENLKLSSPFRINNEGNQENRIKLFLDNLPFQLTQAQENVIADINSDLKMHHPMHRLIQGDVGSGKTVVSALAILQAIEHGYQACLMAPTGLLAEQHYHNFLTWLEPLKITVACLTGKVKGKARKSILSALESGDIHVLVGTHALFQDKVIFDHLGLLVVDEQHRFGVEQRLQLKQKGSQVDKDKAIAPHTLVMTATPIPRTLAMTAYADLSCSIIDELPPGRQSIDTVIISQLRRDEVIQRIHRACQQGKQAYWICTLVEESEILQCQSAEASYESLKTALVDINVGLLHGQMDEQKKLSIMAEFKAGDIQLLIATTVVEVGVDVPNASLMIIENPERLGLSQLHQLRGRVGRGSVKSACVLLYGMPLSKHSEKRLKIIRSTTDGFEIAEEDLKLRGPGEVLGTRQTGYTKMLVADLIRDYYLIPEAQKIASHLLKQSKKSAYALVARWIGGKKKYEKI